MVLWTDTSIIASNCWAGARVLAGAGTRETFRGFLGCRRADVGLQICGGDAAKF